MKTRSFSNSTSTANLLVTALLKTRVLLCTLAFLRCSLRAFCSQKRIAKTASIFLILLVLSACSGPPWSQGMMEGPPQADGIAKRELPPLYIKGWQEGCETGISANTNSMAKFRYKFQQDSSLVMNDIYYRGWKDAFDYCQRYTRMYYSRQFP